MLVSQAYDQLADVYDRAFRGSVSRAEDLVMKHELALRPGRRVLDVGCGTGLLLELFPHLAGPDSGYLGVDVSAAMLERARRKFPAARFLQLDVAEMSSLWGGPIEPGSFDVVVSLHSLSHAPDQELAMVEILNALAPGGRFYLTFFGARYAARPSYIMNQHGLAVPATFHTPWSLIEALGAAGFGGCYLGSHHPAGSYRLSGINAGADHLGWLPRRLIAAWLRLEQAVLPIGDFYHLVVDGRKAPLVAACARPPAGWWCSRGSDHHGPCAARRGRA